MFKKIWDDDNAVSPVIATILMVAITVVLAGVLVVYMQQFSNKPGTNLPTASVVPTPFSNPADGVHTNNGGGWSVRVASISSAPLWGEVTVQITKDDLPVAKLAGVKPGQVTFWQNNGTTTPKWFIKGANGIMQYSANGNSAKAAITTSMSTNDLQTVEFAYFIVIDTDGSNTMTAGDLVLVFENYSGGLTRQTGGSGYALEFAMSGSIVASTTLS